MKINQDYVKEKVMKQLKTMNTKNRQKRNMNKDKGVMKNAAEIRETLQEY